LRHGSDLKGRLIMPLTKTTTNATTKVDADAYERIRRLQRYYALQAAIDSTIIRPGSRAELFSRICQIAVDVGEFIVAWVGLASADGNSLEPVAQVDHVDYLRHISIRLDVENTQMGPSAHAFCFGQLNICNDVATDPRMAPWREHQLAAGIRASVSIPFREQGRVIGVLTVYANQPGFFDAEEKRLLEAIGADISHALDVIAQRDALELAAVVFRTSGEGIVVTDANRTILAVNPGFCEMSGYAPEDVIGLPVRQLLPAGQAGGDFLSAFQALEEKSHWKNEFAYRQRDGTIASVWLSVSVLRDKNNNVTNYIGILSDLPTRKIMAERIHHLSDHSAITDLPNRRLFMARLEQALPMARTSRQDVAVFCLVLARFHALKNVHGHLDGDAILRAVAERLGLLCGSPGTVAHLSDDEFAFFKMNAGQASDVAALAQRTLEVISLPIQIDDRTISITANVGISTFPKDGVVALDLANAAEHALETARRTQRSGFRFFSTDMEFDAARREALESGLRNAVAAGTLTLHYQAQVELSTGKLCGIDTVLRWIHPSLGPIAVDELIPIADEIGLMPDICTWALREACRQNKAWQAAGYPGVPIGVVLPSRLLCLPNIVQQVEAALRDSALAPSMLELDLKESALIDDRDEIEMVANKLKALGVQLVLDDFGTGFSSLASQAEFPFRKIKIARNLIRDVTVNPVNAAIVTATIDMARKLDAVVLATGVETKAQMNFLRANQCDAALGPLYGEAVSAIQFERNFEAKRASELREGSEMSDTILLLDDEPSILSSLKRLLRRDGYRILTAENTTAAFELLALNRVDVVLSDHRMPDMSGTEFLQRVKKLYPDTIRIVLSGYTDVEVITDAINRGAIYRFLTKPWDDDSLRAQIGEAVHAARVTRDGKAAQVSP
jgi:PAS domain S-box-containing protein/diguanylate cyclase (GGDEF)-like protein